MKVSIHQFSFFRVLAVFLFLLTAFCRPAENLLEAALSGSEQIRSSVSTFTFPLSYSLRDLERSLNKSYPGIVFEDTSFDDNNKDNTKVRAWRDGNIKSISDGKAVFIQIPLRIEVEYKLDRVFRYELGSVKLDFPVKGVKKFSFKIIAIFRSQAEFDDRLVFHANTSSAFKWLSYPYLDFYFIFKFRIAGLVGPQIAQQLEKFAAKIDDNVQKSVSVANFIQPLSAFVKQPIALDENNELWLSVAPLQTKVLPLSISSKNINLTLSLKANLSMLYDAQGFQILIKQRSPSAEQPLALNKEFVTPKKLDPQRNLSHGFFADFLVSISSSSLQQILLKYIVDNPISFDKSNIKITVQEVYLSNESNKLHADVYMTAQYSKAILGNRKFKFMLKLSANPFFDTKKKAIRLQNIDYTINSESGLLKLWSLARKEEIKQAIVESIYLSSDEILTELNSQIDTVLADRPLSPVAKLRLRNYKLLIKSVFIRDNYMTIFFNASGNFAIELHNLF